MSKKKKESTKASEEEDSTETMFDAVRKRSAMTTTVDDWSKKYLKDKVAAMLDLINFLIRSCGSTATISDDQLDESGAPSLDQIISAEYFREGEADYPIISRKYKKFAPRFKEFWNKLITKCSNKILYDGYFMETINTWISTFAESPARPFRHTATIAGLEIIGALIKIVMRVNKDLDTAQRQLTAEKRRSSGTASPSGSKASSMQKNAEKYRKNKAELDDIMETLFKGVFAHRYRDVFGDIRTACIASLGPWMLEYQDHFLDDQYLKYLGWALNDRDAEVRQTTLEILDSLYANVDLTHLRLWTERFGSRVVEMSCDIDPYVSLWAVKVATHLARLELLEEDDITKVSRLITDDNRKVRLEAANFVYQVVFDKRVKSVSSQQQGQTPKGKNKGQTAQKTSFAQVKALLELIGESLVPELPHYVVDALWGKLGVLQNWNVLCEALLNSSDEQQSSTVELTESEQTLLARVLNASIKKAMGLTITPAPKSEQDSKPEPETDRQQYRETFTKVLVTALPRMLTTFQADSDILEELAELPQYMLLDIYATQRQKSLYSDLLRILTDLFQKHTTPSLLLAIAGTFKHLSETEHGGKGAAKEGLTQLVDGLVDNFNEIYQKLEAENSEEDEAAVIVCLTRLDALSRKINLHLPILDDLNALALRPPFPEISDALSILHNHVLWQMTEVKGDVDRSREVAERRDNLLEVLEKSLRISPSDSVKERAFILLCDVLMVFSPQFNQTSVPALAYRATRPLEDHMRVYFEHEMESFKPIDHHHHHSTAAGTQSSGGVLGSTQLSEEEAHLQRLIEAFIRPLATKRLSSDAAPTILVHFAESSKFVSDLIKIMLAKLRDLDGENEWTVMLEALKLKYQQYVDADNDDDRESQKQHFKELALRLAQSYGVNIGRFDGLLLRSLQNLLRHSLEYAFENPKERFDFLAEGANKFVSKLTAEAAVSVFAECKRLQARAFPAPDNELDLEAEENESYATFYRHLERVATGQSAASATSPAKKKRTTNAGGGRKKKVARDLAAELEGGEENGTATTKKRKKQTTTATTKRKSTKAVVPDEEKRRSPRKKSKAANYKETVSSEEEEEEEEEEMSEGFEDIDESEPDVSSKKRKTPEPKGTSKKSTTTKKTTSAAQQKKKAAAAKESEEEEEEEEEPLKRSKANKNAASTKKTPASQQKKKPLPKLQKLVESSDEEDEDDSDEELLRNKLFGKK